MSEYANGADGSCQECGAETDEEWHLYCRACYRRQQGWDDYDETDRGRDVYTGRLPAWSPPPAFPGDERWKVAYHRGYHAGYEQGVHDERERRGAA